jgi:hypothetical protein
LRDDTPGTAAVLPNSAGEVQGATGLISTCLHAAASTISTTIVGSREAGLEPERRAEDHDARLTAIASPMIITAGFMRSDKGSRSAGNATV